MGQFQLSGLRKVRSKISKLLFDITSNVPSFVVFTFYNKIKGEIMEGAVTLWMPDAWTLEKVRHPYQRTYRDDKMAKWETDDTYCDTYGFFIFKVPFSQIFFQ